MSEDKAEYNERLAKRIAQLEEMVLVAEGTNRLLRAEMGAEWTDKQVLQLFAMEDLQDGILGAVMAVLQREIARATEEAETLEERGEFGGLPGAVGAARRLRLARDRIIELWQTAQSGGTEAKVKPRGYG